MQEYNHNMMNGKKNNCDIMGCRLNGYSLSMKEIRARRKRLQSGDL